MKFSAAIPDLAGAIKVGGGDGDAVRLMLDCYLSGEELMQILQLRGEEIYVTLEGI